MKLVEQNMGHYTNSMFPSDCTVDTFVEILGNRGYFLNGDLHYKIFTPHKGTTVVRVFMSYHEHRLHALLFNLDIVENRNHQVSQLYSLSEKPSYSTKEFLLNFTGSVIKNYVAVLEPSPVTGFKTVSDLKKHVGFQLLAKEQIYKHNDTYNSLQYFNEKFDETPLRNIENLIFLSKTDLKLSNLYFSNTITLPLSEVTDILSTFDYNKYTLPSMKLEEATRTNIEVYSDRLTK